MGAKHVDMIVEDSHVYLVSFVSVLSFVSTNDRGSPITKLEPTGERHLIDASTATRPSIGNTWFLALIKSLVQKFTGNKPGAQGQKNVVPIAMMPRQPQDWTALEAIYPLPTVAKGRKRRLWPHAWDPLKAGGMRRKVKRR